LTHMLSYGSSGGSSAKVSQVSSRYSLSRRNYYYTSLLEKIYKHTHTHTHTNTTPHTHTHSRRRKDADLTVAQGSLCVCRLNSSRCNTSPHRPSHGTACSLSYPLSLCPTLSLSLLPFPSLSLSLSLSLFF